jgi:protein-S-isoprenylcysteine O-methyltransferase Ste14
MSVTEDRGLWRWLVKLAHREHSPHKRVLVILVAGAVFLVALPALLTIGSLHLDRWLGLDRPAHFHLGRLIGVLLSAIGLPLGLWSVVALFMRGRGTPVPFMATQQLVVQGPYAYSRNPMVLGVLLMYMGLAVYLWSLSAVVIVLIVAAAPLAYIRFVEEREMEQRFGQSYRDYASRTPFILPRLRKPS